MLEGIKHHESFVTHFRQAKDAALNCGLFFVSARTAVDHGNWITFLNGYTHKLSLRTIQFYTAFADDVLAHVKQEKPNLIGLDKLAAAAREMVLHSPKGLVALARELKLMRKFGEYDAVKYRAKQLTGGDNQIEFNFDAAEKMLAAICDPKVKLPDDLEEAEELVGTLKSATIRAEKHLRSLRPGGTGASRTIDA